MRNKFHCKRLVAGVLCAAMAVAPAGAFDPTCDETFYITADAYGAPLHSSIVKSYVMNGAKSITDYGSYTDISNLTNAVKADRKNGMVTFELGEDAPDRFYFEGETDAPLTATPWTVSVSYTLNGAPAEADELAGATGVVEVTLDVIPNPDAPEYFRNNFILQAATLIDQDDIISLEAEGAQVQTVANMKAVVFMAFPGSEEHFTLRIGADDFSFAGWTVLMIPATLSQIDQISELREVKEKAEDSAEAISDSVDVILNTLSGMSDSLRATANGLDALNGARATISSGKGAVYASADRALDSLRAVQTALAPFDGHLQNTADALTKMNAQMNQLDSTLGAFQPLLNDLAKSLDAVEDDLDALSDMIDDGDPDDITKALSRLTRDLDTLSGRTESMGGYLDDIDASADKIIDAANNGNIDKLKKYVGDAIEKLKAAIKANPTASAELQALLAKLQELKGKLDQIAGSMGDLETEMALITMVVGELKDILGDVGSLGGAASGTLHATGDVVASLSGLTGALEDAVDSFADYQDDISGLTGALSDASGTLSRCARLGDQMADVVHGMQAVMNEYHPGMLGLIGDSQIALNTAIAGVGDLTTFLGDTKSLVQKAGAQLDAGTQKTLSGLSRTLNQAAVGLDQTPVIQNAKTTVEDLIRDEWDEHTGELDNLLLMDGSAEAVSLTSEKNPSPTSLQIMLRTAEITGGGDDADAVDVDEDFHAEGNFWSRLIEIFRSIKMAILSLFGK